MARLRQEAIPGFPQEIPNDDSPRLLRLRKKIAMAAISALVAIPGVGVAKSEAAQPIRAQPTYESARLPQPRSIDELPAYGQEVSPELQAMLKNSTVAVLARVKVEPGQDTKGWLHWATGVKVSVESSNQPLVMSTAHSFDNATGWGTGVFTDPFAPKNTAENFAGIGANEYTVEDSVSGTPDALSPAAIDGISISTTGKSDILFMSTDNNLLSRQDSFPRPKGRPFNEIPALPFRPAIVAPTPGEQVALYGMPFVNGSEPIATVGTYVGRLKMSEVDREQSKIITRELDFVAVEESQKYGCRVGDSGGAGMLPDGRFLTGLSEYSLADSGFNQYIQTKLKVNLAGMDLCAFSVIYQNTASQLLNGFNAVPASVPSREDLQTHHGGF